MKDYLIYFSIKDDLTRAFEVADHCVESFEEIPDDVSDETRKTLTMAMQYACSDVFILVDASKYEDQLRENGGYRPVKKRLTIS